MNRIDNTVSHDRISTRLQLVALSSCLVVVTGMATFSPGSIPEWLLDRVRGANPSWYRVTDAALPDCTAIEVYDLNSIGVAAVAWDECNGHIGNLCIQCANVPNYALKPTPGTPLAYPKPVGSSDCNGGSGSSSGTCQLIGNNAICNITNGYDCDQLAHYYTLE